MNVPQPPEPPLRQRFPTGKQALLIFFGSIVLSLTTCTSVILLWGERQLTDAQDFLVGLAVYVTVLAPLGGFVVLLMYFWRRLTARRQKP